MAVRIDSRQIRYVAKKAYFGHSFYTGYSYELGEHGLLTIHEYYDGIRLIQTVGEVAVSGKEYLDIQDIEYLESDAGTAYDLVSDKAGAPYTGLVLEFSQGFCVREIEAELGRVISYVERDREGDLRFAFVSNSISSQEYSFESGTLHVEITLHDKLDVRLVFNDFKLTTLDISGEGAFDLEYLLSVGGLLFHEWGIPQDLEGFCKNIGSNLIFRGKGFDNRSFDFFMNSGASVCDLRKLELWKTSVTQDRIDELKSAMSMDEVVVKF